VDATRDVQVNVVQDIADVDEVADVLLNVGGYDEIAVIPDSDPIQTDGNGLSPTGGSGAIDVTNGTPNSFDESNYVSLIENDVEIVFGHEQTISGNGENRLLPDATVTFEELITLVNENPSSGSSTNPTDIAFGADIGNTGLSDPPSVQIVDSVGASITNGYPNDVEVDADSTAAGGSPATYDVEVTTGSTSDSADKEFGIAVGTSSSPPDINNLLGP
jgi:hypothetical protein